MTKLQLLDGPAMTYGGPSGQPERPPRNKGPVLAGVVVVVLIGVIAFWPHSRPHAASSAQHPITAGPSTSPTTSTATPTAQETGSARVSARTPAGTAAVGSTGAATRTAQLFAVAWLQTNPSVRRTQLAPVTDPKLATELTATAAANIPRATAVGEPALVAATAVTELLNVDLSDGSTIQISLHQVPATRYGWLVSDVEPV